MPPEGNRALATVNTNRNLVKFGHVVFEICEWTDRQTDRHTNTQKNRQKRHTHHNTSYLSWSWGLRTNQSMVVYML